MGAWDYTSYGNDAVMDIVDWFGGSPLSSDKTKDAIQEALEELPEEKETFLGVIVYLAISGHSISKTVLNKALEIAQEFHDDNEYLENWDSTMKRKANLLAEIEMLTKKLHTDFLVK